MAAPEGNENSSVNNRLWANTIRRAIAQSDAERLRRIAEKLLTEAEEGKPWAIRELGDRLDGKAPQAITGFDGGPVQITEVRRTFVDPK